MNANPKREEGFILVAALLVVAIVGVMVAGSLILSLTNRRISSNDSLTTQVLNVAQAGNAYWKAELVSHYRFMADNFHLYKDEILAHIGGGGDVVCGNYFGIGVDTDRDGDIDVPNPGTLPTVTIPMGAGQGTVDVDFSVVGSAVRLEGHAEYAGAKATVVEEFTISSVNVWNTAIFAETGAAHATIEGRAEIRGAIHLLGENAGPTDTVLNLTGSFGMGNTYRGLSSSLNVDATEMRLTYPDPTDLCATLRVRSGQVKLDGSSNIGVDEATNPKPFIDNLKGIYTNDGIEGGTENVNVFSNNGMDAKYDAGNSFDFPNLDDVADPNTGLTWRNQMLDNALILSLNRVHDNGSIVIEDDRTFSAKSQNGITVTVSTSGLPTDYRLFKRADSQGNEQIYALSGNPSSGTGCFAPLFGVDTAMNEASVPDSFPFTLTDFSKGSYALATAYSPLLGRSLLPLLGALATHKGEHGNDNANNNPPSKNVGTPADEFRLIHNDTDDFQCSKFIYKNGAFEVLTDVHWFSGDSSNPQDVRNTLYVGGSSGVVAFIGGDLRISGGTGQREIGYKGNGILFSEQAVTGVDVSGGPVTIGGNIILEIDLLPAAGKIPQPGINPTDVLDNAAEMAPTASTLMANTYPHTSVLGTAARNQFISQGAQNRFTLAVYAEDSVKINQQTLIAGAIVTQKFDAGSQVPTVIYVPNLSEHVSRFMPGSGGNGFAVSNVAWNRSF